MDLLVIFGGFFKVIRQLRQSIQQDVFDYQQLMHVLSEYRKPRDKITRLLADGSVIRIKKGLYCFGDVFRRGLLSREYLANLIYGPSCVSLQYALSHYGLIPERVDSVTSITTNRSRRFNTPMGNFYYYSMPETRYFPGIVIEKYEDIRYLIASPEKAVIDTVCLDKRFRGRSISAVAAYLQEDLRIDTDILIRMTDMAEFSIIARFYHSYKVSLLIRYLEKLSGENHA